MNHFIVIITCFLFTILFSVSTLHAEELVVGLGNLDYPPFYFEKDGKIQGAAIEIAEKITKDLGHKLIYKRFPWARVQYYLKTGTIDMMVLYFKSPDRAKYVEYTDVSHINESSFLFITRGKKIPYNGTLKNLDKFTFGNVKGYSHGKDYNNAKHIKKFTPTNETLLVRMLVSGRIDIAVGNKPAILIQAKKEKFAEKIVFLNPPIDKGPNFFAFSKKNKNAGKLTKQYTKAVKAFKTTAQYRKILKKYNFAID